MKQLQKVLILLGIGLLIAACVPSEQQINEILSAAEQTAVAQITFVPVTYTPDVNTVVAQTFAAMTVQAAIQPLATNTPTVTPVAPGSISGTLSYPSEGIPPLRVVAFNIDGLSYQYVDTLSNQSVFQITGLAPGIYHVVAYIMDGTYAGGYTEMVPCGLSVDCPDHSLIDVTVVSGLDAPGVNPADWYAPEGTFPPYPLP
jgi:hypothetical protein